MVAFRHAPPPGDTSQHTSAMTAGEILEIAVKPVIDYLLSNPITDPTKLDLLVEMLTVAKNSFNQRVLTVVLGQGYTEPLAEYFAYNSEYSKNIVVPKEMADACMEEYNAIRNLIESWLKEV